MLTQGGEGMNSALERRQAEVRKLMAHVGQRKGEPLPRLTVKLIERMRVEMEGKSC